MVSKDPLADIQKRFGEAVRSERERQGLSQEELGFRSALDRTYISGVERGVRNPTLRVVARLAKALSVKPSKLMLHAEKLAPSSAS